MLWLENLGNLETCNSSQAMSIFSSSKDTDDRVKEGNGVVHSEIINDSNVL